MKHREKTEKAAASCINDRNTERMVNKGNQMQHRDVEMLWSFKGLNLTVLNADGQIWNEDDKKSEMLSNSIQLHEEWNVKRNKRVKESSKTNPVWYKHLMEMSSVEEKAAWRKKILTQTPQRLHHISSGDCRIQPSGSKTAPEGAARSRQRKGICFSCVPCLKNTETFIALLNHPPKEQPWKPSLEMKYYCCTAFAFTLFL